MINTSRFLMSVFSICILTIGVIFLWLQIIKPNNAELPSISQQSEDHDETLQVETPKRRPFLTKKHPSQHVIPNKQMLYKNADENRPSFDTTVIPPSTHQTDVQFDFPNVQFDFPDVQFRPTISPIGLIYMYNQGKFDLDYVVDYLESQHHFDATILEKLEPRRAFRYIARTSPSMGGTKSKNIAKAYAERILEKDPDNPDAQLHMVRYEKDETKIIQRYKQILTQHPDHPNTLSSLGCRLLDHSPEEALQYLKKANRLDPTIGLFSLGLIYEKLGDVKTAWFCYNKSVLNRRRWKARFPPSRVIECFFMDESSLSDIEGGGHWRSVRKYVSDPNGNPARVVLTFNPVDVQQEREIREFYQFRDWVRNIESKKLKNRKNNFLVREIEKHLDGGKPMFDPERIIRAYEITTRYPRNEGIQHLKKTDPEIALEIERLLQGE